MSSSRYLKRNGHADPGKRTAGRVAVGCCAPPGDAPRSLRQKAQPSRQHRTRPPASSHSMRRAHPRILVGVAVIACPATKQPQPVPREQWKNTPCELRRTGVRPGELPPQGHQGTRPDQPDVAAREGADREEYDRRASDPKRRAKAREATKDIQERKQLAKGGRTYGKEAGRPPQRSAIGGPRGGVSPRSKPSGKTCPAGSRGSRPQCRAGVLSERLKSPKRRKDLAERIAGLAPRTTGHRNQ